MSLHKYDTLITESKYRRRQHKKLLRIQLVLFWGGMMKPFVFQICCFWSMLTILGCQGEKVHALSYFDAAEDAYRAGQYEIAHQNYSAFLKLNPDPQLARLSERRILAIEREIECVLGQKSGPRPAYVNQENARGNMPVQQAPILYKSERPVRMPK